MEEGDGGKEESKADGDAVWLCLSLLPKRLGVCRNKDLRGCLTLALFPLVIVALGGLSIEDMNGTDALGAIMRGKG